MMQGLNLSTQLINLKRALGCTCVVHVYVIGSHVFQTAIYTSQEMGLTLGLAYYTSLGWRFVLLIHS